MSFGIALSGLDAAQSNLDITANNIANSATTGFKSSTPQFGEVFSASQQGLSTTQIGGGVTLSDVEQQFAQGNIQNTGNSLDFALNGNGFLTVSQGGALQYTRAGAFQTNNAGFVVNAQGQFLQVYAPTSAGNFNTTSLVDLQIPTNESAPQATTSGSIVWNLPANASPPADPAFAANDPNSYNQSTSVTVYDSLGAAHTASFYFVNTGGGTWNVYQTIDGTQVNANASPVQLTYSASGLLSAVTDAAGGNNPQKVAFGPFTPATGGNPMNITYNFNDTTQYGQSFAVTSEQQNGFTTGQLSGVSVSSNGVVQANYTNGQSTALGQIAVANFADQEGLQQVGNTNWVATFASGQPIYGAAGSAGVGTIDSGSLEASNVNITSELVNMITAQRAFQANAEMISAQNQITQTVIGIPTNTA
jgi:flagellar hook protein FlgE